MAKQRRLAFSCTSLEALENCIRDQCSVICIEDPLYFTDRKLWQTVPGIENYNVTDYPSMHFFILLKIHGANQFDSHRHEVCYFPLQEHGT